MNRRLLTLLVALLSLASAALAQVSQTPAGAESIFGDAATSRTRLDVYSTQEVEDLIGPLTVNYYFTETSADVAGYEYLSLTATTTVSSDTPVTPADGVYTLIDQWISTAGDPGITQIQPGTYELVQWIAKTAGGDDTMVYEAWLYDDPTFTFVASSSEHVITADNAISRVTVSWSIPAPVDITATTRLVIKAYGKRAGATSNTLQVWYGGQYEGYFGFNIPSTSYARVNGNSANPFAASELRAATLRSADGASDAITLGSSGIVSMPNQSFVDCYMTNAYPGLASDTYHTASYTTEVKDNRSEWSVTGFTPLVSGVYNVSVTMTITGILGTDCLPELHIWETTEGYIPLVVPRLAPVGGKWAVSASKNHYMTAGRTYQIRFYIGDGGDASELTAGPYNRLTIAKIN